ncbi:MAG: divergent polysaccharide deacetylase family protein [Robiginitomaculum sp.]
MNRYSHTQIARHRGPSLARHALLALCALCAVPAIMALLVQFLGNPRDAVSRGGVTIAEFEAPAPVNGLDGGQDAQTDLPNLMGATTPLPDKPSATNIPANSGADILGNGGIQINPSTDLAGQTPAPTATLPTVSTRPTGPVPTQATIGGQPIGDASNGEISLSATRPAAPGQFIPSARSSGPLPRAPITGMTRMTPRGPVPKRSASGRAPSLAYAKPFAAPPKTKTMAVIVGGLGINTVQTQRAIDSLPAEITLSFAPQTQGLQSWVNKARAKGHEVILEIPMEPYNFDPSVVGGRYTLRANTPAGNNIRNLDYLMSRAQGYFAVTNYLGGRFFDSEAAIAPVMSHLGVAGIGFVYDGVGINPAVVNTTKRANVPWVQNRSVIDATPNQSAVEAALRALEASADGKTTALGMGFSYPATIDAIIAWSDGMEKRKVTLAPASYAFNNNRPPQ